MSGWRWAAVNDAGRVIGGAHHSAKLTDDDIDLIHALRAAGLSYAAIAAKFDEPGGVRVSKSHVERICNARQRCQTVMGHKRLHLRFTPADIDEFDAVPSSA